ncbi:MAG: hypothetical protein IPK26_14570 [Planctomycetes bacterium]|nr:hypothetical protein [Planctomycetota bacterium]
MPTKGAPLAPYNLEIPGDNQAWARFQAEAGGQWIGQWNAATGTPKAIFGSGLPIHDWRENTLVEARRHAVQLLSDRADLLGLGTSEFREIIGARMGRTWSFVFDQFFRGLPVIGGRADVRVHMVGRVSFFGSSAVQVPADFGTTPRLDELTARQIAWAQVGELTGVSQPGGERKPQLVIWSDVEAAQAAPFFLAWEIPVSNVDANGGGPIGRYYVDANTGRVLHYTSDKHECGFAGCTIGKGGDHGGVAPHGEHAFINTTGTVMAWTRIGPSATSALVNIPLAGVEVNVPGIGVVVTNANGQFTVNINANTSVTVNLNGIHNQLVAGGSAPSVTQTMVPGVPITFQFLTSGASAAQAAHTNTYHYTWLINEYCRAIMGNSPELNTANNVLPTVNIASTCNAYYTNNTINFYAAGGSCNNTGFSSVVNHEWGHGLDDRYGGISQVNGLSEGWGDVCSAYQLDYAIIGEGFFTNGNGIRDANNTRQYPSGSGVHDQGETWMGFAWKFRNRLATTLGNRPNAIAISNDIVLGSIVADATNQADAVTQVFIADDDDGNLNNGTPHSADLIFACNQHSLPYPGGGGPTVPANNECSAAIAVTNGISPTFTSVGSTTSSPAWPCASGGNDVWFRYASAGAGTLTVSTCSQASWDTAIQIFSGTCAGLTSLGCLDDSCGLQTSLAVPVTAGTYYIRVGGFGSATGTFQLDVSGPAGIPASTSNYGAGCYNSSKAFYELFANGTTWDLDNTRMTLVKTGNYYIAQASGNYVAPTGAAQVLTLSDDSFASVTLASAFPFPGGSTTTLEVCSNGFVSAATGNGNAYIATAAAWLASVAPRWGHWTDLNPTAGGQVKFEQIGSISYVTYDGVFQFGTTTPNTFQLQFNRSNGNVTYAWQTMATTGAQARLVGYAAATPNNDLGSRDISATLPGGFRTGEFNLSPLALVSTLPQLGTNLALTTTNYPGNSTLGIQVLSLTQFDPGIDLTSVGAGGCFRYTGLDATNVVIPNAGQSVYNTGIPNNPSLMGLPLKSQTWALAPGANTLGMITSNGVAMVVGI